MRTKHADDAGTTDDRRFILETKEHKKHIFLGGE